VRVLFWLDPALGPWIPSLRRATASKALTLRVFRGEVTPAQRNTSLNTLLADLAGGVLVAE